MSAQAPQPFIVISLLLYVVACVAPCLEFSRNGVEAWPGYQILLFGWMGLLVGQFAWLANPLWLGGLVFLGIRRWKMALIFSVLSLLFAANSFTLFGKDLPGDEGGVTKLVVQRLRFGFYLWLASLLIPLIGALVLRVQSSKLQQ